MTGDKTQASTNQRRTKQTSENYVRDRGTDGTLRLSRRSALVTGAGVVATVAGLSGSATAVDLDAATQIEDWHDLDDVRDDLEANYVLKNDLTQSTAGYDDHASSSANGGEGWEPIDPFEGTFDGDGYGVSGLNISRVDDVSGIDAGLFGRIWSDGTVQDLGVSGTVLASNSVGVLAGEVRGEVIRCYTTGSASGADDPVGGGYSNDFGGLVGQVSDPGEVTDSYTHSDVTADQFVGGLAGANDGVISRCYSTGLVTETFDIGEGLIGAFVADNDQGEVNDSYYDEDSNPGLDAFGNAGSNDDATGLSTGEMQGDDAEDNMSALDFDSTWITVDGDYPELGDGDDDKSVSDYADSESGKVETDGLIDAVDDWRDDEINTFLLLDVAGAWRSGEEVL